MRLRYGVITLTVLGLCLSALAGCAGDVGGIADSDAPETTLSDTASSEVTTSPADGENAENGESELYELMALRSRIKDSGSSVGIAFVDYLEARLSEEDLSTYFEHSETAEEYPFLRGIDAVSCAGENIFVLVPASDDGVITLYSAGLNDDGEFEVDRSRELYRGEAGAPLLLSCNESENFSNVAVSVTDGDKALEFHPMLSLKDGWSVDLQSGCCDISIDSILKYVDRAYYMLPMNFPEIADALEDGRDLCFAGSFYFCDQTMLRFELGVPDEAGFVCEKQYAVSFDATYATDMDTEDRKWYVLGAGIGSFDAEE